MQTKAGWRAGDAAVGIALLLTAVVIWLWLHLQPAGLQVQITAPSGTQTYALTQARTLSLQGENGITVTVEIRNGAVWFVQSECPDRVCVHSGKLSKAGQSAACVPAGITVRVLGEGQVDAVAS